MRPERRLKGRNGWGSSGCPNKSDPPVHNLLQTKIGLDKGGHFTVHSRADGLDRIGNSGTTFLWRLIAEGSFRGATPKVRSMRQLYPPAGEFN